MWVRIKDILDEIEDYKFCNVCGAINFIENEKCHRCGNTSFVRIRPEDVIELKKEWRWKEYTLIKV